MNSYTPNPTLDNKLSEELLPDFVRTANLEHAHRLLVYVLRRPEVDFTAPNIEPVLRRCRSVNPEYNKAFYQIFQALNGALIQYIRFEESCTMSGKYRPDLDTARAKLKAIIERYENEEDLETIRKARRMLIVPENPSS